MSLTYDVLVRHEVYLTLKQVRGLARTRALDFIEELADDPFLKGDTALFDENGRRCEVKIIGKLALIYWPDHAEKEMRVVELIDADRFS